MKSITELRPEKLKDVLGQDQVKSTLDILLKSARVRGDVLPHLLFDGPPGLGKTTFARAVANEYNSKLYKAVGGNIASVKDIMPDLMKIKRGDILFIDEVHRVKNKIQECLFTVMEDFRLDVGRGLASFDFEPFTIIGATTDAGMLLKPFRDRFNIHLHLQLYEIDDLVQIALKSAEKLQVEFDVGETVRELVRRCRGTPRIVNSYLRWLRDWVTSHNLAVVRQKTVNEALNAIGIDQEGLDDNDRMYINTLRRFGKPVGIRTLVAATSLSQETIEHVIEPYLIRLGKLDKTSKGRMLV